MRFPAIALFLLAPGCGPTVAKVADPTPTASSAITAPEAANAPIPTPVVPPARPSATTDSTSSPAESRYPPGMTAWFRLSIAKEKTPPGLWLRLRQGPRICDEAEYWYEEHPTDKGLKLTAPIYAALGLRSMTFGKASSSTDIDAASAAYLATFNTVMTAAFDDLDAQIEKARAPELFQLRGVRALLWRHAASVWVRAEYPPLDVVDPLDLATFCDVTADDAAVYINKAIEECRALMPLAPTGWWTEMCTTLLKDP